MIRSIGVACLLGLGLSSAEAGVLVNGVWKSERCGRQPEAPFIDDGSVDGFNKSVLAINAWQEQAKVYFECLVKEANEDNKAIANSANAEQSAYRESVEAVRAAAEAAKNKLEGK